MCNLRFADDIDLMAGRNSELRDPHRQTRKQRWCIKDEDKNREEKSYGELRRVGQQKSARGRSSLRSHL